MLILYHLITHPMRRLSFFWWGCIGRHGWWQFGRSARILADKDWNVHTVWTFQVGPLEIQWWNDPNWRALCFTPEEAAAADAED